MDKLTGILVDLAAIIAVGLIVLQATDSLAWMFGAQLLTMAYGMYNFACGHSTALVQVRKMIQEVREELGEAAQGEAK